MLVCLPVVGHGMSVTNGLPEPRSFAMWLCSCSFKVMEFLLPLLHPYLESGLSFRLTFGQENMTEVTLCHFCVLRCFVYDHCCRRPSPSRDQAQASLLEVRNHMTKSEDASSLQAKALLASALTASWRKGFRSAKPGSDKEETPIWLMNSISAYCWVLLRFSGYLLRSIITAIDNGYTTLLNLFTQKRSQYTTHDVMNE